MILVLMVVLMIVSGLIMTSCVRSTPAPTPAPTPTPEGRIIKIASTTAYSFGEDLRIGVANIGKSDYVDNNGVKHHSMTAGLWLNLPREKMSETIYTGQSLKFGEYVIHVEEIKGGIFTSAYVVLRIEEP